MNRYNPAPYALDLKEYPKVITAELPGPKSQALHARCTKHFKGLSEQVKLFPVAFESGKGCTQAMDIIEESIGEVQKELCG